MTLLLALDRSTDVNSWTAVQAAVDGALAGLSGQDRVAITTYVNQVEPRQAFTSDMNAARGSLAQVAAGGNFTAFNLAVSDALSRTVGLNTPRRAIIVVADSPDNVSPTTNAAVVDSVRGKNIPIYVFGYGAKVLNVQEFPDIAQASGGHYFQLDAATGLQSSLDTLVKGLQQSYQIDLNSTLRADNQQHTLIVNVTTSNGSAEAMGRFVATAGSVTVTVPSLVSGQPVAGVVNLTAAAQTPAPIKTVEYSIDGQVVATTQALNTAVAWDSGTVQPGKHALQVTVTDSAGNSGTVSVQLNVIQASPALHLVKVDSAEFPKVTTFVDAYGSNGLPLVGLTAENFTVTDSGQAVPPDHVGAQVDTSQPLHLVLVLDKSVAVSDWSQLRNAANRLIDSLRSQDELAIYAFSATNQLVQNATSDAKVIKAALATVQPGESAITSLGSAGDKSQPVVAGPSNALYQAILDGENLAGAFPPGRRAVIVLTNGMDDTHQLSLDQVSSALQAQSVPLYILGFGSGIQDGSALAGLAQMTGGTAQVVNAASDVRSVLDTLFSLLQQGYQVTFQSALKADNADHPFGISLSAQNITAAVSGNFVAKTGIVSVTVPNITDGQTLGGAVNLTAQTIAPAPIASVVYKLNSDVLTTVDSSQLGSSVVWNSDTVKPGVYALTVTATDAAGNTGTTTVNFTVVAPITVTAALNAAHSRGRGAVRHEGNAKCQRESLSQERSSSGFRRPGLGWDG